MSASPKRPAKALPPSEHDLRAAQVAHVLARAVRDGELLAADALRILRHELRRRNVNRALQIEIRSVEAQRVIDHYPTGTIPKNNSLDALHADHVYPFTEEELRANKALEQWIITLRRLRTVVCVTAAENYQLEHYENAGITGPQKYVKAGVTFTTHGLPWEVELQDGV
jgi:hypothetical protein